MLANIKRNIRKSRFIQKRRRPLKKFENKKFVIFNEKDLIFHKYICKMYIFVLNKFVFFLFKRFYIFKYICKMYKLWNIRVSKKSVTYIHTDILHTDIHTDIQSYRQSDSQRSSAPKNGYRKNKDESSLCNDGQKQTLLKQG